MVSVIAAPIVRVPFSLGWCLVAWTLLAVEWSSSPTMTLPGVAAWNTGSVGPRRLRQRQLLQLPVSSSIRSGWHHIPSESRCRSLLPAAAADDNNDTNTNTANENDASAAERLLRQADQLRRDVDALQETKDATARQLARQARDTLAADQRLARDRQRRYSTRLPILKPDGTTVDERVDFVPVFPEGTSSLRTVSVASTGPLGLLLGEASDEKLVVVDEVAVESPAAAAGLVVGDVLRACTACRVDMDQQATWQLIVGGIGQPRTNRFVYAVDLARQGSFEEVLDALASNRMDPQKRPVVLVVERRDDDDDENGDDDENEDVGVASGED